MTATGKPVAHVARWDLDKTYLRTDFDTLRDLVRTAFERPDEKRTNPGAATLLREMMRAGVSVHILSGSPEQMRRRLEDKLRLDGIVWDSFVLKPNLQNVLRLRFRALRDQLGYKLPSLVRARAVADAERRDKTTPPPKETLFGDDAEADAFVYSLYADVVRGAVPPETLARVASLGRMYEDVAAALVTDARGIDRAEVVERILIHLERQTPPEDLRHYGPRVVPFYNYLQAALVVFEDGRLEARGVLSVASELVVQHRFDGEALARSYAELGRRGHLRGTKVEELESAYAGWVGREGIPGGTALGTFVHALPAAAKTAAAAWRGQEAKEIDYEALVVSHNARRHK